MDNLGNINNSYKKNDNPLLNDLSDQTQTIPSNYNMKDGTIQSEHSFCLSNVSTNSESTKMTQTKITKSDSTQSNNQYGKQGGRGRSEEEEEEQQLQIKYLRQFKSGQATVFYGFDLLQKKLAVVKKFNSVVEYCNELNIFKTFESDKKYQPLKKFVSLPYKQSLLSLEIFFNAGLCSLNLYLKEVYLRLNSQNVNSEDKFLIKSELVQQTMIIFIFVCQFVFEAAKLELYHGDIKEPNIILNQTSNQNRQIDIIDFGVSELGNFSKYLGYTPGYLDQSKYFQKGFKTKEERIRAELLCVAKMVEHTLSMLDIDLKELQCYLGSQQGDYNTDLFKQIYQATLLEQENVMLDYMQDSLSKMLPLKCTMNFNFIDKMSKAIIKHNVEYGLEELLNSQNLEKITEEFIACMKCKLLKRAYVIIKKLVLDEKFRFLKTYFQTHRKEDCGVKLMDLPIFLTNNVESLNELCKALESRVAKLDFGICLDMMLFCLKTKKFQKFQSDLLKKIEMIYMSYKVQRDKNQNYEFLIKYYLAKIKLELQIESENQSQKLKCQNIQTLLKVILTFNGINYGNQNYLDQNEIDYDKIPNFLQKIMKETILDLHNRSDKELLLETILTLIYFCRKKCSEKIIVSDKFVRLYFQIIELLIRHSKGEKIKENNIKIQHYSLNIIKHLMRRFNVKQPQSKIIEKYVTCLQRQIQIQLYNDMQLQIQIQLKVGDSIQIMGKRNLTILILEKLLQQQKIRQTNDISQFIIAEIYNNLGVLQKQQGDRGKAKINIDKSLQILVKNYENENNLHIARSYDNFGGLYKDLGDFEKAKINFEKSLQIKLQVLGNENNLHVAISYINFGYLFKSKGDLNNAKVQFEKALSIQMQCYGSESNIEVASSYNNLGLLYQEQGDLEKAKLNFEKSLEIRKQCYGSENNLDVARSYKNLGNLLKDTGDFDKSKDNLEKSLQITIFCYGNESNLDVAQCYNNLGLMYKWKGDLKNAEINYDKSLQIRIQCLKSEKNVDVARSYNNLGMVYQDQKNFDKAKLYLEKALQIRLQCYKDEKNLEVGRSYSNIGMLYKDLGDFEKSRINLEKSLQIMMQCYGNDKNYYISTSYSNMGLWHLQKGEFENARINLEKSLQIMIQYYGNENKPDIANIYNNIGEVQQKLGNIVKSIEIYKKQLSIWEAISAHTNFNYLAKIKNCQDIINNLQRNLR